MSKGVQRKPVQSTRHAVNVPAKARPDLPREASLGAKLDSGHRDVEMDNARLAARLRRAKLKGREIAATLGVSVQRASALARKGEQLIANDVYFKGKLAPPVVRQAMDRGGFSTPSAVADAIRDGRFRLTHAAISQSTVDGIGRAKFKTLCQFFDIPPESLPDAVPLETRIAAKINGAVAVDQALRQLIGNSAHVRRCVKVIAKMTGELTPDGLARLQRWGADLDSGDGTSDDNA